MPQLVPFYFINQITFAFVLLVVIVYIFSQNTLPRFVRLFAARTFISRSRGNPVKSLSISNPSALNNSFLLKLVTPKELLDNPDDMRWDFSKFEKSHHISLGKNKSLFLFDCNYKQSLLARLSKLDTNRFDLLAIPDKRCLVMCQKLLIFICNELCQYHPDMFEYLYVGKEKHILNKCSGLSYRVDNTDPLRVIASLIIEDVNLLVKNSEGEWVLVSTLTINPVG